MIDQWHGNNVDLDKLSEGIKQFFTERLFETMLKKTPKGHKIEAATERILNVQLKISVNISGDPNDFKIEFIADKRNRGLLSPSMIIGYIASTIGGGAFLRKELNLQEALEKLEKAFWNHLDKQVAELTNSASK